MKPWKIYMPSTIVYIATILYYLIALHVFRSSMVLDYKPSFRRQLLEIVLSLFAFINVTGNLLMNIITNTSVKSCKGSENLGYCEKCKLFTPEDSWHCKECNICILKRDHHCFIFNRCVGRRNKRYFLLYLSHLSISMIYMTIYIYCYVAARYDYSLLIKLIWFINPLLRYEFMVKWYSEDVYLPLLIFSFFISGWSLTLLVYHFYNSLQGITMYKNRHKLRGATNWKQNLLDVFGTRWYLAILWPFARSPLPDDAQHKEHLKLY